MGTHKVKASSGKARTAQPKVQTLNIRVYEALKSADTLASARDRLALETASAAMVAFRYVKCETGSRRRTVEQVADMLGKSKGQAQSIINAGEILNRLTPGDAVKHAKITIAVGAMSRDGRKAILDSTTPREACAALLAAWKVRQADVKARNTRAAQPPTPATPAAAEPTVEPTAEPKTPTTVAGKIRAAHAIVASLKPGTITGRDAVQEWAVLAALVADLTASIPSKSLARAEREMSAPEPVAPVA